MAAGATILTLEAAGVKTFPDTEAHLVLLHRIPAEELPTAWSKGLAYVYEDGRYTTTRIKQLVDSTIDALQEREREEAPKAAGVNPALNLGDDNGQEPPVTVTAAAPPVTRRSFSEDGELALERIGRLAGKDVRASIENGSLNISQRDLIKWADENDAMVKNLVYYIVNQNWSVARALAHEEQMLSGDSTLSTLAYLATAREGLYETDIYLNNSEWALYIRRK
jgi:hypothetical protein